MGLYLVLFHYFYNFKHSYAKKVNIPILRNTLRFYEKSSYSWSVALITILLTNNRFYYCFKILWIYWEKPFIIAHLAAPVISTGVFYHIFVPLLTVSSTLLL